MAKNKNNAPAKPALAASSRSVGVQSTASAPPNPVDSPAIVVSTVGEVCIDTPPIFRFINVYGAQGSI